MLVRRRLQVSGVDFGFMTLINTYNKTTWLSLSMPATERSLVRPTANDYSDAQPTNPISDHSTLQQFRPCSFSQSPQAPRNTSATASTTNLLPAVRPPIYIYSLAAANVYNEWRRSHRGPFFGFFFACLSVGLPVADLYQAMIIILSLLTDWDKTLGVVHCFRRVIALQIHPLAWFR